MSLKLIRILPFMMAVSSLALGEEPADYHHVHLIATDGAAAANWYAKYMEGEAIEARNMNRAVFGSVQIVFFQRVEGFEGSVGSAVDHIGWSFEDLDSKMKEFEEAGIKILSPARELGPIKFGFIEDPWGTKIEVMQDPDLYGFHHAHLYSPDPAATIKWYTDTFGGEATKYGGFLDAIRYGNMWLIVQRARGDIAPTKGRAVDHLSWSFPDLEAAAVKLKAQGVKFEMDVRPFGELKIAFIEGIDGVRIELVQPAAQ